jgi:hypothetical protein
MSCRSQNYNSSDEYDQQMLQSYHSYPWVENLKTRSQFDLDLQMMYAANVDRNNQKPWDGSFGNISVDNMPAKEGFEPLYGFRTQYDMDLQSEFNQNEQSPYSQFNAFNNVLYSNEGYKQKLSGQQVSRQSPIVRGQMVSECPQMPPECPQMPPECVFRQLK